MRKYMVLSVLIFQGVQLPNLKSVCSSIRKGSDVYINS